MGLNADKLQKVADLGNSLSRVCCSLISENMRRCLKRTYGPPVPFRCLSFSIATFSVLRPVVTLLTVQHESTGLPLARRDPQNSVLILSPWVCDIGDKIFSGNFDPSERRGIENCRRAPAVERRRTQKGRRRLRARRTRVRRGGTHSVPGGRCRVSGGAGRGW
jgi:hypothetical protein